MRNTILLTALAVLGVIVTTNRTAIGIRNNNPLNLREVGIEWNGKTGERGGFTRFESPFYGIRAAANDLKNDWLDGNRTLGGLIAEWAPDTENNTRAYINHVSSATGIAPNAVIKDVNQVVAMVETMILHENGEQPYSQQLIANAVHNGMTSGAQLPIEFNTQLRPGENA